MENKKILVVTPEVPYPLDKNGFTLTLGNLIREWIAQGHEVDVLSFGVEGEHFYSASKYYFDNNCRVFSEPRLVVKKSPSILELARSIFYPRSYLNYCDRPFEFTTDIAYDLTVFSRFESSLYLDKLPNVDTGTKIFFELDAISLYYLRSAKDSCSLVSRYYYSNQFRLVRKQEKLAEKKVDKLAYLSSDDVKYLSDKVGLTKLFNIRNGVEEYHDYYVKRNVSKQEFCVSFSGDFKYKPNLIAAKFIIDEILPELIISFPRCKVKLIGRDPSDFMLNAAKKYPNNLIVTGTVECVDTEIYGTDIYISPLFVGAGIKNKILNVMKLKLPFVATSISCEGIDELKSNDNYLLCNSRVAKEWCENIRIILANPKRFEETVNVNYNIIQTGYKWDAIAREFLTKSELA